MNRLALTLAAIMTTALTVIAGSALGQATVPIGGPSKVNADRLRWMQYKMVAGRIAVSSSYPGTNMTFGPAHVDGHAASGWKSTSIRRKSIFSTS